MGSIRDAVLFLTLPTAVVTGYQANDSGGRAFCVARSKTRAGEVPGSNHSREVSRVITNGRRSLISNLLASCRLAYLVANGGPDTNAFRWSPAFFLNLSTSEPSNFPLSVVAKMREGP